MDVVCSCFDMCIIISYYDVGGIVIDNYGYLLLKVIVEGCEQVDVILFGFVGGLKWENLFLESQLECGVLLLLCKYFKLFSNLCLVKLYQGLEVFCLLCVDIVVNGFDILCVCELIGGIYFGQLKGCEGSGQYEKVFDIEVYYCFEIECIVCIVFELVCKCCCKVIFIDKVNVL